jgi:hypothetical protein
MRNLVNITNTGDLRYLLDVDELPDNYPVGELKPIMENIYREDEELQGKTYYQSYIDENRYIIKLKRKLIAINYIKKFIQLRFIDNVERLNKEFKLKIKSIKDADIAEKHIIQQLEIKKTKQNNSEKKQVHNFGKMVADIEYYTGVNTYNSTVAQFRRHEQIKNQIIAERKKRNG